VPDDAATPDQLELIALLEGRLIDRAAQSLPDYVRYVPIPGVPVTDDPDCEEYYPDQVTPALHHLLMLNTLERVILGEIRNVMLFLPPGCGKSVYASVIFATYFMGRMPNEPLIAVSYGDDLAKKFGRRCRSVVRSPEYQRVFKTTLQTDNRAVDDWALENGAAYMCCGVLGGVTGNRAKLLLMDDMIRGREDADSPTIREKVWEAYKSDLRTRLKPGGAKVYIGTRWHADDPAGRILPPDYDGRSGWVTAQDGEQWFVVNLPAQCERDDDPLGRNEGEYLWTEWFPVAHWEQEKVSQGIRNWAALYQQRPAPESGNYFLAEWLRWYDPASIPAHLSIYMAADYAVTDGEGDWTAFGVIGVDPDDNIFILHYERMRTASDVWVERACDLILEWGPVEFIQEKGQIEKGVGPFMAKRQRERNAYCTHKLYASAADKPTRAQAIRGRMAQGKVYLPLVKAAAEIHTKEKYKWVDPLVNEVLKFPVLGVDDQVDVLSLFGRRLAEMARPSVPPPPVDWSAVAAEKPTWNSVVADIDRRDSRQRGRIS